MRHGRREEFAALEFRWGESIPDAHDPATFASAKLSWQWPEGTPQAGMRLLYADLLEARRRWPALADRRHTTATLLRPAGGPSRRGSPGGGAVLRIERGRRPGLLALANLGPNAEPLPARGREGLDVLLSTEDERYGGSRRADALPTELLPFEILVYGCKP